MTDEFKLRHSVGEAIYKLERLVKVIKKLNLLNKEMTQIEGHLNDLKDALYQLKVIN